MLTWNATRSPFQPKRIDNYDGPLPLTALFGPTAKTRPSQDVFSANADTTNRRYDADVAAFYQAFQRTDELRRFDAMGGVRASQRSSDHRHYESDRELDRHPVDALPTASPRQSVLKSPIELRQDALRVRSALADNSSSAPPPSQLPTGRNVDLLDFIRQRNSLPYPATNAPLSQPSNNDARGRDLGARRMSNVRTQSASSGPLLRDWQDVQTDSSRTHDYRRQSNELQTFTRNEIANAAGRRLDGQALSGRAPASPPEDVKPSVVCTARASYYQPQTPRRQPQVITIDDSDEDDDVDMEAVSTSGEKRRGKGKGVARGMYDDRYRDSSSYEHDQQAPHSDAEVATRRTEERPENMDRWRHRRSASPQEGSRTRRVERWSHDLQQ